MARIDNLDNFLTDIATAIRAKTEKNEQIPAEQFDQEILSIETGIDTSDATAISDNITISKTAYVNGEKITGTLKFAGIYTGESELPSGSEYHDSFAIINQEVDYPTRPGNYSDYCILNNNGTIYLMQFDATESHKLYIQKSQYTWSTTNYGNRKTIYWWKLNTTNNTWATYMSGYSCGQMLENTSFSNYIESTFQLIDIEDGVSSRPVLRDVKERELILPELWLNAAGTWRKELVDTTDGNRDASKLLSGYSMYAYNQKISGAMPDNGSLEYNPTTTTQFLPTGYISGGVINAVDSTIDENIVPENIKKGVTILGIEGTAEGGGGSSGDIPVKLFETVEEMQSDVNPEEGDLALVYREEIQNATVDSTFSMAKFPATVVLPSAITDYVDISYRAVDNSVMFDCWGMLDSTRFSMDCYTDTGSIRIEYESSDGITYTRTDGGEELIDFGTSITYMGYEEFNELIGYFIQCGGNCFEGLYEYKQKGQYGIPYNFRIDNDTLLYDIMAFDVPSFAKSIGVNTKSGTLIIMKRDENGDFVGYYSNNSSGQSIVKYNGKLYYANSYGARCSYTDLSTGETTSLTNGQQVTVGSLTTYIMLDTEMEDNDQLVYFIPSGNWEYNVYVETYTLLQPSGGFRYPSYYFADTQLTVSGPDDILPGKIGYGKNGIVVGDETVYGNVPIGEAIKAQSTDPYKTYELCEYTVNYHEDNFIKELNIPEGMLFRRKYICNLQDITEGLTYHRLYKLGDYFMYVGYNETMKNKTFKILNKDFECIHEYELPENTAYYFDSYFRLDVVENNGTVKCACYSKNNTSSAGVIVFIEITDGTVYVHSMNITDSNVLSGTKSIYIVNDYVLVLGSYVYRTEFNGTSLTQVTSSDGNISAVGVNADDNYVYIHTNRVLNVYNIQDFSFVGQVSNAYALFGNPDKKIYACLNNDSPTEIYSINGTEYTKITDYNLYTANLTNYFGMIFWYYNEEHNFVHNMSAEGVDNWVGSQNNSISGNTKLNRTFNFRNINPIGDNYSYAMTDDGDVIEYIINYNKVQSDNGDYHVLRIDNYTGIIIPIASSVFDGNNGPITPQEYNTALETADEILGNTAPEGYKFPSQMYIGERIYSIKSTGGITIELPYQENLDLVVNDVNHYYDPVIGIREMDGVRGIYTIYGATTTTLLAEYVGDVTLVTKDVEDDTLLGEWYDQQGTELRSIDNAELLDQFILFKVKKEV